MGSKTLLDPDPDPQSTYFVEIGFAFALMVMAMLLGLMWLFSPHEYESMVPVQLPLEMSMAGKMKEPDFQPEQPAQPPVNTVPRISFLDEAVQKAEQNLSMGKDSAAMKQDTLQKDTLNNQTAAKKEEADVEDPTPMTIIEEKPAYPGGPEALSKFLGANIKYPPIAKDAGIIGTVIVSFVVEKDGSITHIKVLHGIGGGCNEEAVRVVGLMPKWSPGKQKGHEVRTQIQIPLGFFLIAR